MELERQCDRCGKVSDISHYREDTESLLRVCRACRNKHCRERNETRKIQEFPDKYVECPTCGYIHAIERACFKCRSKEDAKLRAIKNKTAAGGLLQ